MSRDLPLYPTEQQIAAAVLGPGHFDEWKAMAIVLERHGLPKIDPATGCRYYPAVKQFFDRRNQVGAGNSPTNNEGKTVWIRQRQVSNGGNVPPARGKHIGLLEPTS